MSDKMTIEETINGLQSMIQSKKFIEHDFDGVVDEDVCERAIELLKEQEPRILSLREAIDGKNGLEIDPCVFVEIKDREDIFIGAVNDVSHYNYPNLVFDVGECFRIDRSYSAASKNYLNTDYMKTVRCWTHKPSEEQRKAVKWDEID